MLTLRLEEDLFGEYPDLVVVGFYASNVRDLAIDDDGALAAAAEALHAAGVSAENLIQDRRIADWRDAYRSQGLRASTYRSSPEALARRALRGRLPRTPVPLVNLYNAASLRHLAPIGGYDVARLPTRALRLRRVDPDADTFAPLGGGEPPPAQERVCVYAAEREILCWAFNHRDSAVSCLVEGTDQALFVGEGVTALQRPSVQDALTWLRAELAAAGAVVGALAVADRSAPSITFATEPDAL
ncbi:phenylalanine--tRNA ligase beta subunit-related protein [Haliangium sp.]|uniref:phenylalanine--tRNA ligase beta subunit-related protein n=1 Tax=Haliangium sp. TaxID=2663208 RepID=UPI003D121C16